MQPKPKRPTGVTVLAILEILGGLAGLVGGAALIGVAALVSSANFATLYPQLAGIGSVSTLLYALGALALIFGILGLVLGIGFLGGKGWAWTLGIVVGVLNIVVSIAETAIGFSSNIIGIIFPIIIIYYLMRPHVKAFFGKGPAMAAGMQPPPMMSSSMPMGSAPIGSMGMTCKNCGASIPAGATRCPSCGANL
jgi:zinc ribbon protein